MNLELPSGFEPGTPQVGIQRPNHYVNWEDVCKCHAFISIKQTALKSSTRANIIGETFIFYALLTISPQDKVLKWLFYVGFLAGFFM